MRRAEPEKISAMSEVYKLNPNCNLQTMRSMWKQKGCKNHFLEE